MKNVNKMELKIGIVIFIAAFLLIGLLLLAEGWDWFKSHYYVTAYFKHVGGVTSGTPVNMAGVRIGEVESIKILSSQDVEKIRLLHEDKKGRWGQAVQIRLKIMKEYRISENAVPRIVSASMLGERFIEFPVSSKGAPPVPRTGKAALIGETASDITDLKDEATIIAKNIRETTHRINRTFDEETAKNVKLSIANVRNISETLKVKIQNASKIIEDASGKIKTSVDNLASMTETLKKKIEKIAPSFDKIPTIIEETEKTIKETRKTLLATINNESFHKKFNNTVNNIEQITTKASAFIDESRVEVAKTSKNINDTLTATRGKIEEIGKVAKNAITKVDEGIDEVKVKINKGLDGLNAAVDIIKKMAKDTNEKGLLAYIRGDKVPDMIDHILGRVKDVADKLERPEDLFKHMISAWSLSKQTQKDAKKCAKVLSSLYARVGRYMKTNKTDKYPNSIEELVAKKYVSEAEATCPFKKTVIPFGYIWVANRTTKMKNRTILAFDSRLNHMDASLRNVLFVDGTVQEVSEPTFQSMLYEQMRTDKDLIKAVEREMTILGDVKFGVK